MGMAMDKEQRERWQKEVAEKRLAEFAKLEPGWDGYTADGISAETISASREAAHALIMAGKQITLVPTSAETIAIEWTENGIDCVAEIDAAKID